MQMYDLFEYSSNYSETTDSLWFYSKDEPTDFIKNVVYTNYFKSFKYKAEFLEDIEADGVNGILKKTTITVLLKHLSNF